MKIKITFFLIFNFLQSQSQTRITGKIQDSGKVSLPSATIKLMQKKDEAFLKAAVTDAHGKFVLEYNGKGDFLVYITHSGFKPAQIPVTISSGKDMDIGTIQLGNEVHELKRVEVINRRPLYEYKIDRILINVQENPATAGATILEILERSPGVIVNKQRNSISLNGKEGLIIMIDGKISYQPLDAIIQMLGGMGAGNIEKIELISTPPARYDAGSNAGVINIVLRKNNVVGTNGSFSVIGGYGRSEKTGANINLNNRSKHLNIFGDLSFFRNHTYQYFTNNRFSNIRGEEIKTYTISDRDPVTTNLNGRVGFDYSVNKQLSIGGLMSGFNNLWKLKARNDSKIDTVQASSILIKSVNSETNNSQNVMGNINLNYRPTESEQMNIDMVYLYYHYNNPTNYSYNYYNGQLTPLTDTLMKAEKMTPINIYVAKIDYVKNLKKIKWESGIKGTFSKFSNDVSLATMVNNRWRNNLDFTRVSYLRKAFKTTSATMEKFCS